MYGLTYSCLILQTGPVHEGACRQLCISEPGCDSYEFTLNDPAITTDNQCQLKTGAVYMYPGTSVAQRDCLLNVFTLSAPEAYEIAVPNLNAIDCVLQCAADPRCQYTKSTFTVQCTHYSISEDREASMGSVTGPRFCY